VQRVSVSEKKADVPTDLISALAGVIGVASFPSCLCDVTANNVTGASVICSTKASMNNSVKASMNKKLLLEKKLLT